MTHHELMDYQDARLEFVEFSRAAGRLVERMRRFRPDVVMTFGGDGGLNTHADHMMVSMLTTAAFHWAGQAKRYPEVGAPHQAEAAVLRDGELSYSGQTASDADAVDGDAGYSFGAGAEGGGVSAACLAGSADGADEGVVRAVWR